MNDTLVTFQHGDREITLVGTAHVSRESIEEVGRVISDVRPDVVCVELDEGRYRSITDRDHWENLDVVKVFREGRGFLLMANLTLASFQRRLGLELGIKPGEEMLKAIDAARELGIRHELCDREIQITLRRAWGRCGLWSRSKLLAALLSSVFTTEKLSADEIEKLKNRNELDGMMAELSGYLPTVKETLIDERDRFLAAKIWASGGKKTVAVVGAGHLEGIKTHLEGISGGGAPVDTAALNEIPPRSLLSRTAIWIIPAAIVALIAAGFFRSGFNTSLEMAIRWILWNGSLAGLGAVLALGHPLSILVSFICAPFTTFIPFMGVGIISGITEATVRKPRVADAQDISGDITSLRGIYRNRITRALLVFFLSSLGSSLGSFISIPSLAGFLAK